MALALYRKYRPRTFTEVIGQEHVTEPLMQALRSGRLHHAYLFSGPRGCGKTSSARILARSLNCIKGPTPEPCGECDSCVALAPDGPGSIDVIEIDAASHGGVDDARDLRERAFFAPVASRFKVYIIDEAHMVSPQGFNALLKLVEEPPDYVKFIFATTEPEKVLGTIKSRTHHYPFRLIPPSVLRPYLEKLCREEGVSVEPAVFPLVVRAGGGSVRDSLSVLDQLIAGAGVYGVTYARAASLLGVTDVALIDEMTDALAAGDGAAAFATVDRVVEAGHDPRRFAADLLERLRDLIILQRVTDAAASGIIDAPEDQLDRMASQAARVGQATVSRFADIAHDGLTEMRGTTAPRLLLELIVARMLLPGADDSNGAVLQRLERMERRLGAASTPETPDARPADAGAGSGAAASAAGPSAAESVRATQAPPEQRPTPPRTPTPPGTPTPPRTPTPPGTPTPPPVATEPTGAAPPVVSTPLPPIEGEAPPTPPRSDGPGAIDAAAVRRVWDEVLAMVRRRSQRAWAVVREAMVRDVHGDEIVLVFQHGVHANMFGAQAELLVESVRDVLGGRWQVRAEIGGDESSRGAPTLPMNGLSPSSTQSPVSDASAEGVTASSATDDVGAEGEWPTPATPGASAASAESSAASSESRGGANGGAGEGADGADRGAVKESAAKGSSAKTVAETRRRPAAKRTPGQGGRTPNSAAATASSIDEPRFDPGDEPLDDASSVRETGEEQAIRVLTETFGAERIGETNPSA